MRQLNFPLADLKIIRSSEGLKIKCLIRRKFLRLTPEEWVRQHLIHYLINDKCVPIGLIAAEMPLKVNDLDRRCDVVVFDRSGKPVLIVECKAPQIGLDEKVFHQIAHYNFSLGVDLLMVTNGLHHVVSRIDRVENRLVMLEGLPDLELG